MAHRVTVLDYGSGNVRSACRALEKNGAEVLLTKDSHAVLEADGLVVPGVGAFNAVMQQLNSVGASRLIDKRLAGGRPVLGICVGLQVMFDSSTEKGTHEGLGYWRGIVNRLNAPIVPHMGWSQVNASKGSKLLQGVENEYFYFVHSYAVASDPSKGIADGPIKPPLVTWAEHGVPFVAAVEDGPLCATQFHPEKSGHAGAQLLRNWLNTL